MSESTTTLRPATAGDLDSIMALETSVFASYAWSRHTMKRELRDPNCVYLVAVEADAQSAVGVVVAYSGLLAPRGSTEADIQTLAVAPQSRRAGLGRTIMKAMIDHARDRGAREIFLEVRADNPAAQSLYRSLGFEQIGVRPRYYQPDDVDALVMRTRLDDRS